MYLKLGTIELHAAFAVGAFALTVCTTGQTADNVKKDAIVGAITGAVIGHQVDHDKGAAIGAAIGAIAGASVGRYQDKQQRELEHSLAAERSTRAIDIKRLQDETLKVSLSSLSSFDTDSSEIKPSLYRSLNSLTRSLVRYDRTMLHIIGHTDSTGAEDYNYALSIRRAQSVAQYLMLKGVPPMRLRIDGRGELEPRSDNLSEASRSRNRRVEIFIKPVILGDETDALISPYSN